MTNKKGFTLIELVVVIAILGILAGIAVPRFMNATESARGSRVLADLRTIDSALVLYNVKQGKWPGTAATETTAAVDALKDTSFVGTGDTCTLASEPVPPTGTCRITNNAGKEVTFVGGTKYEVINNRGTLNEKNATQLLATE